MSTLTASAFGYAGVFANLIWPTLRQRSHMLTGQVIACVLMLIHFTLLNAQSGAWIMGTAGLQALLAIPLKQSPKFKTLYLLSLPLTPIDSHHLCVDLARPPIHIFFTGISVGMCGKSSVVIDQAKTLACHCHLRLDYTQPAHRIDSGIGLQHTFSWYQHLDANQNLAFTTTNRLNRGNNTRLTPPASPDSA